MGLPKPKPKAYYTVDQYLKIDRAAEERYYYLDGEIYAMAGESGEHGDVSMNVAGLFFNQLKGKPCRARTKDTKVRSGTIVSAGETSRGLFSYPDIVVICGEPEYHDALKDVILNPTAIVGVLSPSTEAFDRGEKFTRYQTWNLTHKDYLLVSQDRLVCGARYQLSLLVVGQSLYRHLLLKHSKCPSRRLQGLFLHSFFPVQLHNLG